MHNYTSDVDIMYSVCVYMYIYIHCEA